MPARKLVAVTLTLCALSACTGSSSGGTGSLTTPSGGSSGAVTASASTTGASGGTVAASSTAVSFAGDGTTTYGTLEIPAHRSGQRLAAALLLPGSGPTDRDGNDVGLGVTASTLKIISGLLTRQGIMTLRFDKYFTGRTGGGRFAADPGAAGIENDLRQATDAYTFLSRQPSADPAKLLVVGHSEGGMIALNIAANQTPRPAGLALLEPQDERIIDLTRIQTFEAIDSLVAQGKLTVAQARSNATAVTQAYADFRANRTVSTAGLDPAIVQFITPLVLTPDNARYLRTWDAIVPTELAAKVAGGTQVLITEGTRDTNVPPRTIDPLVRALAAAGTAGPGLTLVPNTDHFMHLPSQPLSDAVLAPAIVAAITRWATPFAPK